MNNSKLMIAVATAALIPGTSFVFAQQQGGAPGGAPAGQMAPKSAGGQTTGQPATPGAVHNGAAETKGGKNAAEERGEQTKPNRAGEAQPNRNRETTGQAPQNERQENRTEGNKATNGATEERRLDQNRVTEERGRDNERNRSTTGQGAAPNKGNVSVNITPEKRTQRELQLPREHSPLPWGINRDEVEPTLRRWHPHVATVAFLSYLSPRGLPRLFAAMTNQIPVARHGVPSLVYVTFGNAFGPSTIEECVN
jgi:hypothetical protein